MIDWDHFLCGLLANEWSQAHTLYASEHFLNSSCKSDTLFPTIIQAIYDFGMELWKN